PAYELEACLEFRRVRFRSGVAHGPGADAGRGGGEEHRDGGGRGPPGGGGQRRRDREISSHRGPLLWARRRGIGDTSMCWGHRNREELAQRRRWRASPSR